MRQSRMRQYGILETQFVLAHPCLVVVDQVDAPPKREVAKGLVGGISTIIATYVSCLEFKYIYNSARKQSCKKKKSCHNNSARKQSCKRVRGFTIIPHIRHHCAQGTLEPVNECFRYQDRHGLRHSIECDLHCAGCHSGLVGIGSQGTACMSRVIVTDRPRLFASTYILVLNFFCRRSLPL
jgi:hypothetical protein